MGDWIEVCRTDEVDREDLIPVTVNGQDYAIYRSPDDRFFATDGHCTHEQVLLCDGLVDGTVIECPKHNGRFDYTTGSAIGRPVTVDLRTYPTRVEGDVVSIDLGQ